jgi:hypothetical protein
LRLIKLILPLTALTFSLTAGPIDVGGGWYGFCFAGVGSPATAGCENGFPTSGNSFTFSAPGNILLQVTDAFQKGDSFDVYVDSIFRFSTSAVAIDAGGAVTDPDAAFADLTYSSGQLVLAAGSYTVDIFTKASPFGGGGAFLQVSRTTLPPDPTGVPEPSTYALMAAGVSGLWLLRRRTA